MGTNVQDDLRAEGADVVVVGDFNPAIFQPHWFSQNSLVPARVARDADVQLIHPDLSQFRLGTFLVLADRNRLQVATEHGEEFPQLRDLIIGALELLSHTPVRALGFNRHLHYELPQRRWLDRLGHITGAAELFPGEGTPKDIYVRTQRERPDGRSGHVQILIQQSPRAANGLYVSVNDHYDLLPEVGASGRPAPTSMIDIIGLLHTDFFPSVHRSTEMGRHIFEVLRADTKSDSRN